MPRPQQLGRTLVTITVPRHVANCAKKVLIDSILQTKIPASRSPATEPERKHTMNYKFYEPAEEQTEPIGDYCPSIDAEPAPEPKPPFKPLWNVRKTSSGRVHELPGKWIYTGASEDYKRHKWAAVDTSPAPAKYEPALIVTRRSVAELFRYIRREARNGH